jgi:3'-phosphoadenosine 5'-phosphosulfate sulfotransferase (PAPS reductase)/FAD synthetase
MLHIVKFSGGKDSLATLLTVMATVPREDIRVVFCDTGWEHPDTYAYIKQIGLQAGLPIITVSNQKYPAGMPDMVRHRKRFPALKARFCTEALKVEPGIDYVLSQTDDVTVYQGVRADESPSRRMLKRDDEYFRYYFEPFSYKSQYQKEIKSLLKRIGQAKAIQGQGHMFEGVNLHDRLRELQQLHEVHKKPVFHRYRPKEVRAWCNQYSADVVRPVLNWTAEEVISYCLDQGYPLNPLYYRGARRVGCFPCINSSLAEVASIAEQDAWRIDEIRGLEKEVGAGSAFFSNDKIPKAHHTGVWVAKKEGGKSDTVNHIDDVVAYVQRFKDQAELLDKQAGPSGCISHYNICEKA